MGTASTATLNRGSPITPTDPGLPRSEHPRLSRQCMAILGLLAARPQYNYELALVGLSYTRRLSDLRAAGFRVELIATGEAGARLYGLVVPCPDCSTSWQRPARPSCAACGGHRARVVCPGDQIPAGQPAHRMLRPITLASVEDLSWGVAP